MLLRIILCIGVSREQEKQESENNLKHQEENSQLQNKKRNRRGAVPSAGIHLYFSVHDLSYSAFAFFKFYSL